MAQLDHEDLELLRDTAARFFGENLNVDALRHERDEPSADGFDRQRWREMAEMGWTGILLDEADATGRSPQPPSASAFHAKHGNANLECSYRLDFPLRLARRDF